MPRLGGVPKDEVTDESVKFMYEFLFGQRDPLTEPGTSSGTVGDWWPVFALSPEIFRHCIGGFAIYQNPKRSLKPHLRELGQTLAGWHSQSSFTYSQHCKSLRIAGVAEEKIEAITSWSTSDLFDDEERAVLAYTECLALAKGRTPDGVFNALKEYLSDLEILELTYIVSLYIMHSIMSKALRTEWDDHDDPVFERPTKEGFIDYSVPDPGFGK